MKFILNQFERFISLLELHCSTMVSRKNIKSLDFKSWLLSEIRGFSIRIWLLLNGTNLQVNVIQESFYLFISELMKKTLNLGFSQWFIQACERTRQMLVIVHFHH